VNLFAIAAQYPSGIELLHQRFALSQRMGLNAAFAGFAALFLQVANL